MHSEKSIGDGDRNGNGFLVRFELTSPTPPLEVESFELVDRALRFLDARLGGVEEINGSPRNWWRTFRS
jgi:hypothetical protein